MKLAADRVNAQPAWSTGPHRLLVEILDYNDNPTTAVMKTIDAGQDASVLAIVQSGEEELAETTTLVANSFGVRTLFLINKGQCTNPLPSVGFGAGLSPRIPASVPYVSFGCSRHNPNHFLSVSLLSLLQRFADS
jgi:hypothetical protein